MLKRYSTCDTCGRNVECSSEEPVCDVLKGWLSVSHYRGLGSVGHYSFCSFTCLKKWVDAQAPEIPRVFLESFGGEKGGENTPR